MYAAPIFALTIMMRAMYYRQGIYKHTFSFYIVKIYALHYACICIYDKDFVPYTLRFTIRQPTAHISNSMP